MLLCVVFCLHIVVAQVVGRAQLVAFHIVNHPLSVELLDDEFTVLRVGMNTADSVVRNPNRIVAILGINHKIPWPGLVLIQCHCNLGVEERGQPVDGFLEKILFAHPSNLVEPCGVDNEQQNDDNRNE